VPAGTRGFNLTRADLRAAILRDADALSKTLKRPTDEAFERYLESGPQPELARIMLEQLLEGAKLLPKKQAPQPEKLGALGAVVRAVIDELDRVNRRR